MRTKRLMRGFRYGEKGFTLIELLIVVAILGILAAVVIPNFTSLIGTGDEQAQAIELRTVQTAMIAIMANDQISSVEPLGTATDVLDGLPLGTPSSTFNDFLVNTTTSYKYTWTSAGVVSPE